MSVASLLTHDLIRETFDRYNESVIFSQTFDSITDMDYLESLWRITLLG